MPDPATTPASTPRPAGDAPGTPDTVAAGTAGDLSAAPDAVVVRIPAEPRHLRTVRMVAATVASEAGFSIDEIDDVRMGADELCAAVLESGPTGPLVVAFRCRDAVLRVEAEARATGPGKPQAPIVDELRGAILGAVTDDYTTSVAGDTVAAAFTKVRATRA